MKARSGVFTKYVVEFVDVQPSFKVSNDISAGDFLIDADVTVTMARDTAGTTFTITLYNLPQDKADALDNALTPKSYQSVKIGLGYFETGVQPVVDGIYERVESKLAADTSTGQTRLVTTITGKEKALRACSDAKYSCSLSDDDALNAATAAKSVLKSVNRPENTDAHPGIDKLITQTVVSDALDGLADTTFNNNSVLTVLSEIANKAKAELLIVDQKVFLSASIKYDPVPPGVEVVTLDPSANLAQITKTKVTVKPKTADGKTPSADQGDAPADATIRAFTFTALGDPTMRPGQKVTVANAKGYASELRINSVTHQFGTFSTPAGYVCNGEAVDVENATAARDALKPSAAGGAQAVASAIKSQPANNPIIEVTSVKAVAADNANYPYQVDLYYGQTPKDKQQPSIEVAIGPQDVCHLYRHRPIASPFAWRKCGLVTPVYPTMKALVAHNLGSAADGIVTGYIWSKLPDLPPPPNEPGDWWLCLPIDFKAETALPTDTQLTAKDEKTGKPTFDWANFKWDNFDATEAVNDLTAGNGCRVIELKGLKITVGAHALRTVGTRPTPGAAEECTIAHSSGAIITIKKSEIDVDTGSGPKLTLSSSGITLTDGTLNIQLANGKLAIG
jgi:hypothetical protein